MQRAELLTGNFAMKAQSVEPVWECVRDCLGEDWERFEVEHDSGDRRGRFAADKFSSLVGDSNAFELSRNTTAVRHLSVALAPSLGERVVVVTLDGPSEQHSALLEVADGLAVGLGVSSGYLHPAADMDFQNQRSPLLLTPAEKSSVRIAWSSRVNADLVDVEQNPSHIHRWRDLIMTSAWVLYLGAEFQKSFPLQPFDQRVYEVVELGADIVRVQATRTPDDVLSPSGEELLRRIRTDLGFETFAHQVDPPFVDETRS